MNPVGQPTEQNAAGGQADDKSGYHQGEGIGGGADEKSYQSDPEHLTGHGGKPGNGEQNQRP